MTAYGTTSADRRPLLQPPQRQKDRTSMALRPLQDRIVVRRLDPESVSKGGIIIPENAKEKPMQAIVVAIGSGRLLDNGLREPIGCEIGDTVLIGKYQGTDITLDGEKLLVIKSDDVLGVVETD